MPWFLQKIGDSRDRFVTVELTRFGGQSGADVGAGPGGCVASHRCARSAGRLGPGAAWVPRTGGPNVQRPVASPRPVPRDEWANRHATRRSVDQAPPAFQGQANRFARRRLTPRARFSVRPGGRSPREESDAAGRRQPHQVDSSCHAVEHQEPPHGRPRARAGGAGRRVDHRGRDRGRP